MRSRRGDSPAGQPRGNALLRPTDTSGAWVLSGRYAAAQCSVQSGAASDHVCRGGRGIDLLPQGEVGAVSSPLLPLRVPQSRCHVRTG
jgi:hypothetical protein